MSGQSPPRHNCGASTMHKSAINMHKSASQRTLVTRRPQSGFRSIKASVDNSRTGSPFDIRDRLRKPFTHRNGRSIP